ncbi:MAG: hypothetical protein B6245_01140 [Desulfobacteraceae bacterium 4572_88]|nr:MAG: hypothetical protein B6245_01140 [Desulfobacteraceae bacterium 4572_88]
MVFISVPASVPEYSLRISYKEKKINFFLKKENVEILIRLCYSDRNSVERSAISKRFLNERIYKFSRSKSLKIRSDSPLTSL